MWSAEDEAALDCAVSPRVFARTTTSAGDEPDSSSETLRQHLQSLLRLIVVKTLRSSLDFCDSTNSDLRQWSNVDSARELLLQRLGTLLCACLAA